MLRDKTQHCVFCSLHDGRPHKDPRTRRLGPNRAWAARHAPLGRLNTIGGAGQAGHAIQSASACGQPYIRRREEGHVDSLLGGARAGKGGTIHRSGCMNQGSIMKTGCTCAAPSAAACSAALSCRRSPCHERIAPRRLSKPLGAGDAARSERRFTSKWKSTEGLARRRSGRDGAQLEGDSPLQRSLGTYHQRTLRNQMMLLGLAMTTAPQTTRRTGSE